MTIYCESSSPKSPDGCFGYPDHDGPHYGWSSTDTDATRVTWSNEDDPAAEPLTFTDEELAILITALQPVKHFFPGLVAKLTAAREALK